MNKIYNQFFFRFILFFTLILACFSSVIANPPTNAKTVVKKPTVTSTKVKVTKIAKPLPEKEKNPVAREQMSDDKNNPLPIEGADIKQTEPPIGKDYIEKWIVTSAHTADSLGINPEFMLDSTSFFTFISGTELILKLNSNFPKQKGTFTQAENWIQINLIKPSTCGACINSLTISRNSGLDKEFKLSFKGVSQLFTIKKL